MHIKKILIIIIVVAIVFAAAAFLILRKGESMTAVTLKSRSGAILSFSYPTSWSVDSDAVGFPNIDPTTTQNILLRATAGAKIDFAIRFWDNPNNSTTQNWAKSAAQEAGLKQEPKLVTFGSVKFWILSNAMGPVPSQTNLYTQFQSRIMEINIDQSHVKSDGSFDTIINSILKSLNM